MLVQYLVSNLVFALTFLISAGLPTAENNRLVLIGSVVYADSSFYQSPTIVLLLNATSKNELSSFETKENGQFYFKLESETTYQVTVQDTLFKKPYPIKTLTTKGLTDPTILRCLLPVNRKQPLPKNILFKIVEHPRKDGTLTK